ncbi:MAG TPA: NAD(P)-binding domain-containing protein, partial [Ktedonobacteraceae bacterium]|nr:NAD(P)-binding domain-containing protein [Ktedonobacteraceae bacterium]
MDTLSFVGLGQMGQPMALNLLRTIRRKMQMRVFDAQPERAEALVTHGAQIAEQLSTVASPGGIVFSMVPDDRALLQIALGEGGILKQLGKGGLHVSCSTVSPSVSEHLA